MGGAFWRLAIHGLLFLFYFIFPPRHGVRLDPVAGTRGAGICAPRARVAEATVAASHGRSRDRRRCVAVAAVASRGRRGRGRRLRAARPGPDHDLAV